MDSDLTVSAKRNDQSQIADLDIGPPLGSASSVTLNIMNVKHRHQQISNEDDCEKDGTKSDETKNCVVQTVAMKPVIETLLKGDGKVGVRGNACSGKTSVLYGAMQIFGENNPDWNIIRITNEEHFRACYQKKKLLLVIDDILDQNAYMLKHLDTLKYYIDAGDWKVIFSYSNKSYKTIERKSTECSVLDGGHVINISVRYECAVHEKIEILNSQCKRLEYILPDETSKQCVESVPTKYFFSYVRGYVNTEGRRGEFASIDFFQIPIEEMVQDLENLKTSNRLGFYILFCCSVLGRDLDISTQKQLNKDLSEHAIKISDWLLAPNDKPNRLPLYERMQVEARDVPAEFIESIGNHKYRIKFGCVLRAVHLIILKELNTPELYDDDKLFKHALFLCDFSIIRDFFRNDDNGDNPLQLKIHQKNFRHVAKKFICDIMSGHVRRVGKHPLFSNDEFKDTFISQLSRHNEKDTWKIFSTLDKQTPKALIVFAVEHDKPNQAPSLTNIILKSKKWKKYSRKEGKRVKRHLLVLKQNASALKSAVRYKQDLSANALKDLINSVFINVATIIKWKSCWREEALRNVIKVHAKIVPEIPEITNKVIELFQEIPIYMHLNEDKQSLLHLCVICRNERILERALEHRKHEINFRDCLGQTPLHTAVQKNNLEAVRILIKSGAVIEIKDEDGNTAIHLAVHKSTNILEKLICVNGTDVNVRNKNGQTPYQLAQILAKTEHMKTLDKADVNDK